MYAQRQGTSGGIQGYLYETKLISLILYKVKHDNEITEFLLGSNVNNIGNFDDICFKAKVRGSDRPVAVFIQTKHKTNKQVLTLNKKGDLAKWFDSYLEIRSKFNADTKDALFEREFDKVDCLFVMYTSAKGDSNNMPDGGSIAELISFLDGLVRTGNAGAHPSYNDEHVKSLCEIILENEITALANQMAKYLNNVINNDKYDHNMLMANQLVKQYHVLLAKSVVNVKYDNQPKGYRMARFLHDFFDNNDTYIKLFRDILYKRVDVLFQEQIKGRAENMASCLDNESVFVKEKLKTLEFKVPATFGNKDLPFKGVKKMKISNLCTSFADLINKSYPETTIIIDDSMEVGLLQPNGGIAGTVGNILVLDEETKLYKFTDNKELLGDLAKKLYTKLIDKIRQDINELRFKINVKNFPKLSFTYNEDLVRDFFNKLVFYTEQADQNGVMATLKSEIEHHRTNENDNVRLTTDIILLKYHDEIQKWWMKSKEKPYLTKENEMYENALNNILHEPPTAVIQMLHIMEIKNVDDPFKDDDAAQSSMVAITTAPTITEPKLYLDNRSKGPVVILNLKSILNFPEIDYNTLVDEITDTNNERIFIIVCHDVQNTDSHGRLENLSRSVNDKNTILIVDNLSKEIVNNYFLRKENVNRSVIEITLS